jgi:multiple sugar transport system substrate-binding protein
MKKLFAIALAVLLVFGLTACGGDKTAEKLVIWSFTDELNAAGDIAHFEAEYTAEGKMYEGMEIEYVVVETADYMATILPVLQAGGEGAPDIMTGELDMIQQFNDGGYLADLETLMEDDPDVDVAAEKADFTEYIWKSGEKDGRLTALSWQVTPGAIFFKTDLAAEVWGDETGFPSDADAADYNEQVSEWVGANKFNSLANLLVAQQEVKAHNPQYRLFPDDQAVRHFAAGTNNPSSWLGTDGKLNADKVTEQIPYVELVNSMYGATIADSLTANAGEWSGPWWEAMGHHLTDAESNEWYVMAYAMPTWGLRYIIEPNMEFVDGTGATCVKDEDGNYADGCTVKGNWGMATGPNSYFWGGTYLAINADSEAKDEAFAFVKSMLFDKDRLKERQAADSDLYSVKSVMDPAIASYTGRESLGGMNHLEVFTSEAGKINLSNITEYDRRLNTLLGDHINKYKAGEYANVAETLAGFYADIELTYPEIYKEGLPTG